MRACETRRLSSFLCRLNGKHIIGTVVGYNSGSFIERIAKTNVNVITGISTSLSQFVIRSISRIIEFFMSRRTKRTHKNLSLNLRYDLYARLYGVRRMAVATH